MSTEPGAALEAGNRAFHDAYDGARDSVREQVPILVVLPSELVLLHQGERRCVAYPCPSFVEAKSAAHIAVALFALTCAEADQAQRRAGVTRLTEAIAAALDKEPAPGAIALHAEVTALLRHCLVFAQAAREQFPTEEVRAEFAGGAGPRILKITEHATCAQVAGLHRAADALLHGLSNADQAELQVVVVGDHQARTRSLGMQYFKRRFDEQPGADEQVTYGENITDEQEAISLVATRRLDKRIAQAFFGDDTRLQRDVLGDAGKRCLDQMCFPATRP